MNKAKILFLALAAAAGISMYASKECDAQIGEDSDTCVLYGIDKIQAKKDYALMSKYPHYYNMLNDERKANVAKYVCQQNAKAANLEFSDTTNSNLEQIVDRNADKIARQKQDELNAARFDLQQERAMEFIKRKETPMSPSIDTLLKERKMGSYQGGYNSRFSGRYFESASGSGEAPYSPPLRPDYPVSISVQESTTMPIQSTVPIQQPIPTPYQLPNYVPVPSPPLAPVLPTPIPPIPISPLYSLLLLPPLVFGAFGIKKLIQKMRRRK